MVNWQHFTLTSVQATMFTPESEGFASNQVLATILRQFGERFSGDIQAIPIPPSSPPQIPRVVLQSSDGSWQMISGAGWLNCVWGRRGDAVPLELNQAVRECADVLEYYVNETRVRIGRLGLVLQRACASENPAQTLIRRFCSEETQREPFNRSVTFEIHNHKEYTPVREGVDYSINSWVRCQTGVIEPEKTPAIVVTQDLNTKAEDLERGQFDAGKIRSFFSLASAEADAILKKYFPGNGRNASDR
jgi:hypothetical protein